MVVASHGTLGRQRSSSTAMQMPSSSLGHTKRIVEQCVERVSSLVTAIDSSDENAMLRSLEAIEAKLRENKWRARAFQRYFLPPPLFLLLLLLLLLLLPHFVVCPHSV